ncbi:MAG: two-component sensor histidine kinase [Deltaproteobacteria bacterium]|nr:MAG: two-component sensor histidine kinase [Deltaproteobacteria bacterium]
MFLKDLHNIPKTISFRLTAWYSIIFILASFLLFAIAYFLVSSTLEKHSREAIQGKVKELALLYQKGGIPALEKEINSVKKFHPKRPFFIRIADAENKTLFLRLGYQWAEFDIKTLEKTPPDPERQWTLLRSAEDKNILQIETFQLPDHRWLQVGQTSEETGKLLDRFREIFAAVIIPLVLLGFAGGAFLAFRALRPIRALIHTVHSVETGDMTARVPAPGTGDELDELVRLFNGMLEKIETLILGMKGALDNVAHDLRTPMTRLRGIAEIALQSDLKGDACRETLGRCIEECDQILTMLNTLMDISEAETGTMRLDRREIAVRDLLASAADLYAYVAEDKNITIDVQAPQDLTISADPARMAQVLANLLDNAVKYTPEGRGEIKMAAWKEKNGVTLSVKDQGTGIPEEDRSRIWDRLYRGDRSRHQRGLGLGLSLVRAVVKAHGGTITVESEPDKGSTFSIHLPLTDQQGNSSIRGDSRQG